MSTSAQNKAEVSIRCPARLGEKGRTVARLELVEPSGRYRFIVDMRSVRGLEVDDERPLNESSAQARAGSGTGDRALYDSL